MPKVLTATSAMAEMRANQHLVSDIVLFTVAKSI